MDVCRPNRRYVAILALLLLGGLTVSPPVSAHPDHLQIANEVVSASLDPVDEANWTAQSIVPLSSFYVAKVSLLVSDVGPTDNLTVSIRPDASGRPSTTVMSQGTTDGPMSVGWVDFPLSPYVELQAFGTYWIVAQSPALGGEGYDWVRSPNNNAYPNGSAATSSNGVTWVARSRDYTFRVYGFIQPSFSFSVSVSENVLRPTETALFTINFTNFGPGSSEALWVNISLPNALTYVSDDASSLGGIRSGTSFEFVDINPGSYTFNVTVTPTGGTPNGTVASTIVTFEGMDHVGALLAQSQFEFATTVHNAHLDISLEQSVSSADPGETITVNATIRNTGSDVASDILFEAPMDANATFVYVSPPALYDTGTKAVLRVISSLDPGESVSLNWSVEVNVGTPDQSWILSEGIATYLDPTGTPLRDRASVLAGTQAPIFAPVLILNRPTVEADAEVVASLYYNNTGSASAAEARATWSLGGHYELIALLPVIPYAETPDGFEVQFSDISPGNHQLLARLKVLRGLDNGLPMPLEVAWNATDGNLNVLDLIVVRTLATLEAPDIIVTLEGPTRVTTGSVFVLTATIQNLGDAPGLTWLNLTFPINVAVVGDNGTQEPVLVDGQASWRFPSIPARSHVVLGIFLVPSVGSVVDSFRLSATYTDAAGSSPLTTMSNALAVEVFVPAPPEFPWWVVWIVLLASGIGVAAVVMGRRLRGPGAVVDEVFVADRSGVLLAHRTAAAASRQDEDVLIAMFKVVQDFVRDAFSEARDEHMSALEFGERKILIERGGHHFVAVIYRGTDHGGELASRVKQVSQEIDEKFGPVLETWSGELETVRGIALLLPQIWRRRRFPVGNGTWAKSRSKREREASSRSPPISGNR